MPVVDVDMPKVRIGVLHAFVHFDDGAKQIVDTLAGREYRGNHRHAEQFAQFVEVHVVSTLHGLVEHVERTDHPNVHVYQLGCQIKVPLQIARVNHVDDDIGRLVDYLLAYIQLFGRIG